MGQSLLRLPSPTTWEFSPDFTVVRLNRTTYEDGQHSGKAEAEGSGLCLHLEEHRLPLQRYCVRLLHRADVEVLRWQNGTRGVQKDLPTCLPRETGGQAGAADDKSGKCGEDRWKDTSAHNRDAALPFL